MLRSISVLFLIFLNVCLPLMADDQRQNTVQIHGKNTLSRVKNIYGEFELVAHDVLSGPQVFLVTRRGKSFLFWTVADAQLLLRRMQDLSVAESKRALWKLGSYLQDMHAQPVDEKKHAAIIELFFSFSIRPKWLHQYPMWGIALVDPAIQSNKVTLDLVQKAQDLAEISRETREINLLDVDPVVKKGMINSRAAGQSLFPFMYQHSAVSEHPANKSPTKSVVGIVVGSVAPYVKTLLGVGLFAGGGFALSKKKSSGVTQPLVVPTPQRKPTPSVAQELTGPKELRKTQTVGDFKPCRRSRVVVDRERVAKTLAKHQSAAEQVSLEIIDVEVLKAFKHSCVHCVPPANAANIDDQQSEGAMDEEDETWVDDVSPAALVPLFYLRTPAGVVAVTEEKYQVVCAQCSADELVVLNKEITTFFAEWEPGCLLCRVGVVQNEQVVEIFRKYAPELFMRA